MAKGGFKKMKGGCITTENLVLIIVVILVLGFSFLFVLPWVKQLVEPTPTTPSSAQPTKMMEHFADSQPAPADLKPKEGEIIVALFSADWCPHCKDYKPSWEKLRAANDNKSVNGKKIRFVDADCSDKAHPASSTYKVEGYPTVVAITTKTNKHIERVTTMSEVEAATADM
jgi:thiol-disulfide isomerase/thioredoxin